MSTKTNFKRIALVAVAALGMGVLSSLPANAVIGTSITVTGTAGTASTLTSDSASAGSARVVFLQTSGGTDLSDSVTVSATIKSAPTGASLANVGAALILADTGTAGLGSRVDTDTTAGASRPSGTSFAAAAAGFANAPDAISTSRTFIQMTTDTTSAALYSSALYKVFLDTTGGGVLTAGTYVISVITTPFDGARTAGPTGGTAVAANQKITDINIVVSAAASASLVANPGYSTAVMSSGTTVASGSTIDSSVSAAATASSTAAATIAVTLRNASNAAVAQESITATTTIGTIGDGTTQGRSVTLAASAGLNTLQLRPDGTAGTATITISTPSVTFAAKSAVFYAITAASGVATKRVNTLSVGTNAGAITAVFKDASGNVIGGNASVYAFSDALTVVSETASACTFDAANSRHTCSLTGLTAGTANVTIRNATQSVSSAAIAVTVSTAAPAALKMAWNKASYAPGEKAFLSVWAVDSTGKPVGSRTISQLTSGGITSNVGFSGSGTPAIPNTTTSFALAQKIADTDGIDSLEPVALLTVFMPSAGGTVTVSATGGSSLPASGQVEVKATATVTDSGAAALAAVTALATTVASLKTLITTLTNLVLKIQKKVKA